MLYDTAQGNSKGVRFETTIGINAPVGTVWALIDRLEEWPRWMPSIKNIERLSKEPLAVGSQLSVTARVSGLTVTLLMTIAEFDWERSVVMQGKVLGTKLTRFYALEPVGDMTRVTIGGDVSGTLAWLARRGGKKISDEIALAVKKRIEGWE
ncbi:MAG: SRPBCC family protein [Dehalococcoidia bacterium]